MRSQFIRTFAARTTVTSNCLPIIHHHDYVSELPKGHRFAMKKFHGVFNYLLKDNIIQMKQVAEPDEVSSQVAGLVHTPEYVEKFFTGKTSEKEQRRTGFKWNKGLLRRCRLEAGGTVLGCHLAKERGLACSTGGGTHHAFPSYGSGYCLLNDLAIAAENSVATGVAERVLIVDLDVHQGDGTANIFEDSDSIFTFSMHCQSNFPFVKQNSDLDVGLADHIGDAEYMRELQTHLPVILETFHPGLILYDAGVDPHVKDELGKLDLTDQGLFDRDYYVLDEGIRRGIPLVTVIGGGYSHDLDELSIRHTIVHRAATKIWNEYNL
uniref:Class 4 HDAC protein n=1 Tax=Platynereis dumerilii TaxID=6359 RepID=Q1H8P7_PLADU|nr:class 4 HDAC protein [Platynereis dumerilii]